MMPFYFPDGHAYPRWLSPILPIIMVAALLSGVLSMLAPAQLPYAGAPDNPSFVPGAEAVDRWVTNAYLISVLPLVIGVFVSPLLRYRRADAVQRQQIKVFVWWSMVIFAPYMVFYTTTVTIYPGPAAVPPLLRAVLGVWVQLIGFLPPIVIA